jgi:hypothetical protein
VHRDLGLALARFARSRLLRAERRLDLPAADKAGRRKLAAA